MIKVDDLHSAALGAFTELSAIPAPELFELGKKHSGEHEYSDSKLITHTMEDGTTIPIAEIQSKCRGEYPSTESVQVKVKPMHSVTDALNRIYGTGPIESKKGQPRHLAKYTRKRHKRKK